MAAGVGRVDSNGSRIKIAYSEAGRALARGRRGAGVPVAHDLLLGTLARDRRPGTSAGAPLLEMLGRVPLRATRALGRPRATLLLGRAPRPPKTGAHMAAGLLRAARLTAVVAAAAPGPPVVGDPLAVVAEDTVEVVAGEEDEAAGEEDVDKTRFKLKLILRNHEHFKNIIRSSTISRWLCFSGGQFTRGTDACLPFLNLRRNYDESR